MKVDTCRYCGERIYFLHMGGEITATGKQKWEILNADMMSRHRCAHKRVAKVYTEEEKAEFARRRAAGEI